MKALKNKSQSFVLQIIFCMGWSLINISVCTQHFCLLPVYFLIFHLAANSGTKVCVRVGSQPMRSSDWSTFLNVWFYDFFCHQVSFLSSMHTNKLNFFNSMSFLAMCLGDEWCSMIFLHLMKTCIHIWVICLSEEYVLQCCLFQRKSNIYKQTHETEEIYLIIIN